MMRLRYTRKGWFSILDIAAGKVDLRTGQHIPDAYGCTIRRLIVGPYPTAASAAASLCT